MTETESVPSGRAAPWAVSGEYRVTATARAGSPAVATVGDMSIGIDTTWRDALGLPGPAELLATSFAACLLKNLARTRELLDFEYEEAHADVVLRRQDDPPRFVDVRYTINVMTDEPRRRVDLAHKNLRKHGTVYNTLAGVCNVHGVMVSVPLAVAPKEAEPG